MRSFPISGIGKISFGYPDQTLGTQPASLGKSVAGDITMACRKFLVEAGSRRSRKRRSKQALCAMIRTIEPNELAVEGILFFRFITGQQRQCGFS
jgi:hypothetical protein